MKFICKFCSNPCHLEIQGDENGIDFPDLCPFDGKLARWERDKEESE